MCRISSSAPQESLKVAQDTCEFIGYDINRERVPTLQCTERKYDQHQARGKNVVTGVAIGLATVAASGAM